MVKLIFKSVEINGGQMVAVRLYPPFQQMYEEVLRECNTLKNQEITTKKTDRPRSVYIATFGCQMNLRDSEAIKGLLLDGGFGIAGEERRLG